MRKNLLLLLTLTLAGCTSTSQNIDTWIDTSLPQSTASIQKMIDDADDGETVRIPKARYVYDQGIVVEGREGLRIVFEPGTQLYVDDISADVFTITGSNDIEISGALLRHLNPLKQYDCHGAVLVLRDVTGISITNMELDGCGAIGLSGWNSSGITVRNCLIRHNSFNGIYLTDCDDVTVRRCVITDNANTVQLYNCGSVEMSDNRIEGNGGYWEEAGNAGLIGE